MSKLTNRAQKDLAALSPPFQKKALEIINRLDDDPSPGKKLAGSLKGNRSARLGRSHRILYRVEPGLIIILTVRARRDVYR